MAIEHLNAARGFREQAARLTADAASELSLAAQKLHESGLTVRDIGWILGVSYRRAQQLVTRPATQFIPKIASHPGGALP